jgi:hypothetical protein
VSAPKAAASDEPAHGGSDVERYEQLRGQALTGASGGPRLGLALLQHRGVTAWARAWHTTTTAAVPAPARRPLGAPACEQEIVDVLATMALACAAAS